MAYKWLHSWRCSYRYIASAKMGATPDPSIPHMGLLHGALSTEMVEFLQGNESAEKALQDVEAAYIAKAKEQGFL